MENMRETQTHYTIPNNCAEHTRFGGLICNYDFCTDYKETRNIASRITSDWKFDEQCKKNIKIRKGKCVNNNEFCK